jgi:ubiquitin-conjugating enzyme E2 variant
MSPSPNAPVLSAHAPAAPQARKPTVLEHFSVVAFFLACAAVSARALQVVPEGDAGWLALALFAGYVTSDFTSGLVHWAFDTWGSRDTPVLGPAFIIPFRVHHDDPKDITRHGFIATNGHNCLATLPVLVGCLLLPASWRGTAPTLAFLLALCFGTFLTNQFHKWAHLDAPGPLLQWLQRWHVILPVDHHDVHHTHPYERHYCITTGWLNGLLDAVGFFRRAEWLITRLTGAQPRRDDLKQGQPQAR